MQEFQPYIDLLYKTITPAAPQAPSPTLHSLFSGAWNITRTSVDGDISSQVVQLSPSTSETGEVVVSGAVYASNAQGEGAAPLTQWTVSSSGGVGSASALRGTLFESSVPLCEFDFSAVPVVETKGTLASAVAGGCHTVFTGARIEDSLFSKPNVWAGVGASFTVSTTDAGLFRSRLTTLHATRVATIATAANMLPKTFYQRYGWYLNIALLVFFNLFIRSWTRKQLRKSSTHKNTPSEAAKKASMQAHLHRTLAEARTSATVTSLTTTAATPLPVNDTEPLLPPTSPLGVVSLKQE
jgi:hypothetical protein